MSKTTPTNSPMRSQATNSDFNTVDPSPRTGQEQNTIFSSEIFDPGTGGVESSDLKLPSQRVDAVVQSISQTSETELKARLAHLDQRIDQFSEQLNKLSTNFHLITARLDSLEAQAISTPAAEPSVAVLASQLDARFESLENIFKSQCEMTNEFFANAGASAGAVKVKASAEAVVEPESSPEITTPETGAELEVEVEAEVEAESVAVAAENSSKEHWLEQKQAIMAKYGFGSATTDPEVSTPAESIADQSNNSQSKSDAPATEDSPITTEEASVTTEEASVDELKRQLNSRIREAEVEMSINRARLMQERVEFERAQADLERRAAKLEAKLAASTGNDNDNENTTDENSSIMGRFKRHLGNNG